MEFSFFTTSVPKYKNLENVSSDPRFLYFGTEEVHKKVEPALPYSHFVDT